MIFRINIVIFQRHTTKFTLLAEKFTSRDAQTKSNVLKAPVSSLNVRKAFFYVRKALRIKLG